MRGVVPSLPHTSARQIVWYLAHGFFPFRLGPVPTIFGHGFSSPKDAVALKDTEHIQRPTIHYCT
jgi:hypothetical protein